jgi:hypothetical protein
MGVARSGSSGGAHSRQAVRMLSTPPTASLESRKKIAGPKANATRLGRGWCSCYSLPKAETIVLPHGASRGGVLFFGVNATLVENRDRKTSMQRSPFTAIMPVMLTALTAAAQRGGIDERQAAYCRGQAITAPACFTPWRSCGTLARGVSGRVYQVRPRVTAMACMREFLTQPA